MLFRTHLAFSLLLSLVLIRILEIEKPILFTIVLLIFAILPDLDQHNSKISKKIGIFNLLFRLFSKHRGLLHSVWPPIVISSLLFCLKQELISYAVLFGYFSHLITDSLTLKGTSPFYPLSKKKVRGFIRVGSIIENIIFFILLALIAYILINL